MLLATSVTEGIIGLILVVALLGCAAVCAMKDKWIFFALGWFGGIFWIVGAVRLGKPKSRWAARRYNAVRLMEAQRRFPNS